LAGGWVLGLVVLWAADAHTRQARDTAKVFKLFFGDDPLSAHALAEPPISTELADALGSKPQSFCCLINGHKIHASWII